MEEIEHHSSSPPPTILWFLLTQGFKNLVPANFSPTLTKKFLKGLVGAALCHLLPDAPWTISTQNER